MYFILLYITTAYGDIYTLICCIFQPRPGGLAKPVEMTTTGKVYSYPLFSDYGHILYNLNVNQH